MKAAVRAALSGGKSSAAKAAAEAARVAAANALKARIAAAAAIAQFCSSPENASDQQCVALHARAAEAAAQRQKLVEYGEFCHANYWSFSCSAVWGWFTLLIVLILICCCCCSDDDDDRRRRRR